jgi:hypothetical protein
MHDREIAPFLMAALAGVMANPVHAHKGAKADALADLALAAARATAAKLGVETEERVAPARHDVDELGELRARLEALEAKGVTAEPGA